MRLHREDSRWRDQSWTHRANELLWAKRPFVFSLVLLFGLLAVVATVDARLYLDSDATRYIILARSLAQGHGYQEIEQPVPRAHRQFPFGFPLLLAPVEYFFQDFSVFARLLVMKLWVVLFFLLALLVLLLLLFDLTSPLMAVTICLMVASSPLLVPYAYTIMSDVPYLFFSYASLLFLIRSQRIPGRRRWGLLTATIVMLHAALYVRWIGLTLLCAVGLHFLWRRQMRELSVLLIASLILLAPWLIRDGYLILTDWSGSYYEQFFAQESRGAELVGRSELGQRVRFNGWIYGTQVLPMFLLPAFTLPEPMAGVIAIALLLLLSVGFTRALLRKPAVFIFYVMLYMGVVLVWPWAMGRLVLPLLPLLYWYLLTALRDAVALGLWWAPRVRQIAYPLLAVLILISQAVVLYFSAPASREYPARVEQFIQIALVSGRSVESGSVVLTPAPELFYVFADRKVVGIAESDSVADIQEKLQSNQIDYVLVSFVPLYGENPKRLLIAAQSLEDDLVPIFSLNNPAMTLYALQHPHASKPGMKGSEAPQKTMPEKRGQEG